MTATSKQIQESEPEELEALLPWHATGTLNARDARRVEDALARDPALAKQYAVIQDEYAATIHLNESLGAPSARAMQKLFAAIDAEPARGPYSTSNSRSACAWRGRLRRSGAGAGCWRFRSCCLGSALLPIAWCRSGCRGVRA